MLNSFLCHRAYRTTKRTQKRGAPHRQRMGLARPWIKSISEHSLVYGGLLHDLKGQGHEMFYFHFKAQNTLPRASYEQEKRTFLFSMLANIVTV